jgi:hypothetical protein
LRYLSWFWIWSRLPHVIPRTITIMLTVQVARGLQRLRRRSATTTPLGTTIRRRMDAAAERRAGRTHRQGREQTGAMNQNRASPGHPRLQQPLTNTMRPMSAVTIRNGVTPSAILVSYDNPADARKLSAARCRKSRAIEIVLHRRGIDILEHNPEKCEAVFRKDHA